MSLFFFLNGLCETMWLPEPRGLCPKDIRGHSAASVLTFWNTLGQFGLPRFYCRLSFFKWKFFSNSSHAAFEFSTTTKKCIKAQVNSSVLVSLSVRRAQLIPILADHQTQMYLWRRSGRCRPRSRARAQARAKDRDRAVRRGSSRLPFNWREPR